MVCAMDIQIRKNCLQSVPLRNTMVAARDGVYNRNRLEGGRVYLQQVGSSSDGVLSRGREYPDSPARPWKEGVVWCDDLYIDSVRCWAVWVD